MLVERSKIGNCSQGILLLTTIKNAIHITLMIINDSYYVNKLFLI